jgi:hypothetical protein
MWSKWLTCTSTALLVATVAGCGASSHHAVTASLNVVGDVQVMYPSQVKIGSVCASPSGYQDIAQDSQIKITDAHGTTIGLGYLGAGYINGDSLPQYCDFPFAVNDVPGGQNFYGLQVANRNAITYTAKALAEPITITPSI